MKGEMATMFKGILVKEAVAAEFKKMAKESGLSMTAMLEQLMGDGGVSRAYMDKKFGEIESLIKTTIPPRVPIKGEIDEPNIVWEDNDAAIPKELEGLAVDELPECCQGIFNAGEPTCPHWAKMWVKEYGNKVIGYRNTLTGRTPNDSMYEHYYT